MWWIIFNDNASYKVQSKSEDVIPKTDGIVPANNAVINGNIQEQKPYTKSR